MSGAVIVVSLAVAYLLVAAGVLGALLERERLLNPDGERGLRWLGSLALVVVFWPAVGLLWPDSRPVPSPQPRPAYIPPDPDPMPSDAASMYRGYDFATKDLQVRSTWVWQGQDAPGVFMVDTPASLALGTAVTGQRAFVRSLGLMLTKGVTYWYGDCACRYNFSGFPVVLCRAHQSDADPQGEPDEDEGSVGR